MSRRKILPRREVARYDSVDFASKQDIIFNDQKTMNFVSGVIMDMPSGLPRNYVVNNRNAYRGVETLSDLFAYPGGNSSYDLLMTELSGVFVTGTLKPGRYEQVSGIDPFYSSSSDAFKEVNQHEQGNFLDPFYAIGSVASIGEPGSFSNGLMNKTQIRMSFPVKNKVQMLPNTSSLYYFNITNGEWNIPSNAIGDHVGPAEKLCFPTLAFKPVSLDPFGQTRGSLFFEDKIGFDSYGNLLMSGNVDIHRQIGNYSDYEYCQSNKSLGLPYFKKDLIELLTNDSQKSIQRNSDYVASNDETFTLPIDYPFLIEKIVIEIPFCFGNGWFYDKTVMLPMSGWTSDYLHDSLNEYSWQDVPIYDMGGPAITFSIMSQVKYGTSFIRDMISYGSITHEYDNFNVNVVRGVTGSTSNSHRWFSIIEGSINSKNTIAVISSSTAGSAKSFTGSVSSKLESFVDNGLCALISNDINLPSITPDQYTLFENFLKSEYISAGYASELPNINVVLSSSILLGINTIGRGMSGFAPSGGSIFGGEYTTTHDSIRTDNSIKNPFYVENETKRSDILTSVFSTIGHSTNNGGITFSAPVFLGSKKQSPYLIYPGQKLIVASSKTRPAFNNMKADVRTGLNPNIIPLGIGTLISSSFYNPNPNPLGHDVQFNTGSINISFYGSYVKSNREFMT